MMKIALSLNTFVTGILAGALLISSLGFGPAAGAFEVSQQILIRQQLIQRLSRIMTPFMLLPILTWSVVLVLRGSGSWIVHSVGLALSASTVATTVFVNVPLNWLFTSWSQDNFPSDWQIHVRKWDRANSFRFIFALAAFVCALILGR